MGVIGEWVREPGLKELAKVWKVGEPVAQRIKFRAARPGGQILGYVPNASVRCSRCGVEWLFGDDGNPLLGPIPTPCERCGEEWFEGTCRIDQDVTGLALFLPEAE